MTGWLRRLARRVRYRSFDADLRQEIGAHRAMAERDLEAAGLSPADAQRAAARSLGNVTLAREQARGIWIAPWLEGIWQDLRYGVRALRRTPAFTITALLTTSIGIGLSTSMFTTIEVVFLRSWPVRDADRVAQLDVEGGSFRRWGFGLADLEDFAGRSTTLAHVAASRTAFLSPALEPAGPSQNLYVEFVTSDYFAAAGVDIVAGRAFHAAENRPGAAEPVVVISHTLWQRLFDGAADVVGRQLYFQSKPYTIVGVSAPGWRGPQPYRSDVWLPLEALRNFRPNDELFSEAAGRCCVKLIGRLAADATHERAGRELTAFLQQRVSDPGNRSQRVVVTGTRIWDEAPVALRALVSALVVTGTIVILLLTGANIAHLQLARAFARQREIRTRLALGAARARVIRQLVTEAGLLCVVGGAGGLGLLYFSLPFLMRVSEMELPEVWRPDLTVFGYCIAASLLMAVTFSLLPALRSTRTSLLPGPGRAATAHPPMRFSLTLLTSQIALAAALLTTGSLLTRAVMNATSRDVGFEVDDVIVATYRPAAGSSADRAGAAAFGRAVRAALESTLGKPTAFADTPPLSFNLSTTVRRPADSPTDARAADIAPVSSNTFAVLGIPIVAGRTFSDNGDAGEAVVNERLAALLWPNGDAVGQRVVEQARTFVAGGPNAELAGQRPPDSSRTYVIVGVTRDVYFTSRDAIRPTIHVPNRSSLPAIVLRGGGPAAADRVKAAITGLDPRAAIFIRPLPEIIASRLGDSRFAARAARAAGLLALALATFGVFGVFAFAVEQRRREIGIRVALGATHTHVLGAMFRSARTAVLAGLGGGLLLSLAVGPSLDRSALLGLSPFDPLAFAIVAALLAVAGFTATFIPARRALSIDPAVILKDDA